MVDEALLAGGQGGTLQVVIENELARLLGERGLIPSSDTAIPSQTAGNIQVADQVRPTQLGKQIAHAVYTTINATNPPPSTGQPIGGTG